MKTSNKQQETRNKKPEVRYLNDMTKVLYDQKWLKRAPNFELYYMYRGVKPRRSRFATLRGRRKKGLRYDITIIPPKMLGKEFVKTKGHEHLGKFAELYTVLKGKAIYLIQKYRKNRIEDVYTVKAKKGESVIIPPGYGHITINPEKKELKEANWISEKCQNLYNLFIKKQGACYFAIAQKSKIKNQKSKIRWMKNKNYKKIPKLRFEKPLKKIPKNLDFLKGK